MKMRFVVLALIAFLNPISVFAAGDSEIVPGATKTRCGHYEKPADTNAMNFANPVDPVSGQPVKHSGSGH